VSSYTSTIKQGNRGGDTWCPFQGCKDQPFLTNSDRDGSAAPGDVTAWEDRAFHIRVEGFYLLVTTSIVTFIKRSVRWFEVRTTIRGSGVKM